MFPGGLPGLALLALRLSVAIALSAEMFAHRHLLPTWILVAGIILVTLVIVGWLTPIVSLVALLSHAVIWWIDAAPGLLVSTVLVLDALALCLLGPGAYSLDSYVFGRRIVVVPPP